MKKDKINEGVGKLTISQDEISFQYTMGVYLLNALKKEFPDSPIFELNSCCLAVKVLTELIIGYVKINLQDSSENKVEDIRLLLENLEENLHKSICAEFDSHYEKDEKIKGSH